MINCNECGTSKTTCKSSKNNNYPGIFPKILCQEYTPFKRPGVPLIQAVSKVTIGDGNSVHLFRKFM